MARLSPRQRAWRGRLEAGLRIASPVLDLVVVGTERISRAGIRLERAVARRGPTSTPATRHPNRKPA